MTIKGVKCPNCKDIIVSMHVYDFKRCFCRQIFVDGGRECLRYGGVNIDAIQTVEVEVDETINHDHSCTDPNDKTHCIDCA